jgi:hypothetical protein
LIRSCTNDSEKRYYGVMAGDVRAAEADRIWRFTTRNFVVRAATITKKT